MADESVKAPTEPTYEPPAIESTLTADELARKVRYAGGVQSGLPGD